MKIALFTASVNADNSGDSIIEDAVRRLIKGADFVRFPLVTPITQRDIININTCDISIICGTNLYQSTFACNLNTEIIDKINIPIIPFGIGSSAPIGQIPAMRHEAVAAVKAIHKKCKLSSVRDEASLRFLHSIGVKNTILTGCPVFFHGLSSPEFLLHGEGYTLTPRARLLHIDSKWEKRQLETLKLICELYHPDIVIQSPYDIPIANSLSKQYKLDVLKDNKWQADVYIKKAKEQYINVGFRLHFAMLSLSYGKPIFIIAHDSRVSEFCKLVGLSYFDIRNYSDNLLSLNIEAKSFNADGIRRKWDELSNQMQYFMNANGLDSNLSLSSRVKPVKKNKRRKPRILLLIDKRNWAFDNSAKQIARHLKHYFDFDFKYVRDKPKLNPDNYDLLYVFFWGETYYKKFGFNYDMVIKELSSHRWEDNPDYGLCSPDKLVATYLNDCKTVICTSLRLKNKIDGLFSRVYHTPNGFDDKKFAKKAIRTGELTVGWAGNIDDKVKGLLEILKPACNDKFKLKIASGDIPHKKMSEFYNSIDVFAVASTHEGEPLTLIEAMASGCFPVCVDVGIVPELIRHLENGYIVSKRTQAEFTKAFEWCANNIEKIRMAGKGNAEFILRERSWGVCAQYFKRVFQETYKFSIRAKFRNDDVSWDTSFENFKKFCEIFHSYGLTQLHGITLRGCTNTLYKYGDTAVEYEGYDTIGNIDNEVIRKLSIDKKIEFRTELIDYLKSIPDEIALHGLYHTDYSKMSYKEQEDDISKGLNILKNLFPHKRVLYFIAPFNKVNKFTYTVCKEFELEVLIDSGVHLESELNDFKIKDNTWYRYHHHRFYPESMFDYYRLSMKKLNIELSKNFLSQTKNLNLHYVGQARNKETLKNLMKTILKKLFPFKKLKGRISRYLDKLKKINVEINLPEDKVKHIIEKNKAQPWFFYAFKDRKERWDIHKPLSWIINNQAKEISIFETGCGCGLNLVWLGQQGFKHLHGSDISKEAINAGKELVDLAGIDVELWEDDSINPTKLPKEVDVLIALNWVYLIDQFDLSSFIYKSSKIIKKGGFIVIDTIDTAYNNVCNNQYLTSDWEKPEPERKPSEYKQRYSKDDISMIADKFGFDIVKIISEKQLIPKNVYIMRRKHIARFTS